MPIRELSNDVVVCADKLNPSVFSPEWLFTKGITRDETCLESIFVSGLSKVKTESFDLLVVPERLQFSTKSPGERSGELIRRKLLPIVRHLPHTPYTAIGLNFTWCINPQDGNLHAFSRRLFFNEKSSLHKRFDEESAAFGGYMSRDWNGFRLHLHVRPDEKVIPPSFKGETLLFAFNFHKDMDRDASGQGGAPDCTGRIEDCLRVWEHARMESKETVELCGGQA